ncbi:unnamed protein product [Rhizophagus irregularis]|nr:unnamed protein product [Rhizophagus irregularis]
MCVTQDQRLTYNIGNKKLNLQYLLHLKSGFDARRNCLRFKNNVEINRIRALYADDHGDRRIEELSEY